MKAAEMIAKAINLPPISPAAFELVSLLTQPDSNNDDLVRVLKQDSVLTAKLLRGCNSAALKLDQSVSSVDQAVLILGYQQIYQMVLAMSLRGSLTLPLPAYSLQANGLWLHSLRAATAAEITVGEGLDVGLDGATGFTIGLLHDIGKVITNQFYTRQTFIALRQQIGAGRSAIEAEREVLGTDHAEVGAGLAYMWRLPAPIVDAIALHHSPLFQPHPGPSALAWLANALAHRTADNPANRDSAAQSEEAILFETLGVAADQLGPLLEKIGEASAKFAQPEPAHPLSSCQF